MKHPTRAIARDLRTRRAKRPGRGDDEVSQLAPGGRFVMPLGADRWTQRLICRTRTSPDAYVEEELGSVAVVPLVGAHGWPADATPGARRLPEPQTGG